MLNFDLYAISTDNDERSASIKEFFPSFDEAFTSRFKYANWCGDKGDICIKLFKANTPFTCSHSWFINPDGSIRAEYNF